MANEAVIIELLGNKGDPMRYTVADGTGILKGTLMKISGDRTAAAATANGDIFAGIAASEKVASDGSTTLALYTNGIFDLLDSGSGMTLGQACKINGTNTVATADEDQAELSNSEIVGQVLETATAAETVAVRILK